MTDYLDVCLLLKLRADLIDMKNSIRKIHKMLKRKLKF